MCSPALAGRRLFGLQPFASAKRGRSSRTAIRASRHDIADSSAPAVRRPRCTPGSGGWPPAHAVHRRARARGHPAGGESRSRLENEAFQCLPWCGGTATPPEGSGAHRSLGLRGYKAAGLGGCHASPNTPTGLADGFGDGSHLPGLRPDTPQKLGPPFGVATDSAPFLYHTGHHRVLNTRKFGLADVLRHKSRRPAARAP